MIIKNTQDFDLQMENQFIVPIFEGYTNNNLYKK